MQLPHRRFVTFLVGIGLDDREIARLLQMDGLVVPTPAQMSRTRFDLADIPESFMPWNPADKASARWVADHDLSMVFEGDSTALEAFTILRSVSLRHPTEVLLLGGCKARDIARFVEDHGLTPTVTADGVEYYRHLLWDVRALSLDAWVVFLEGHLFKDLYLKALAEGKAKALEMAKAMVNHLPLTEQVTQDPMRFVRFMKMTMGFGGGTDSVPLADT